MLTTTVMGTILPLAATAFSSKKRLGKGESRAVDSPPRMLQDDENDDNKDDYTEGFLNEEDFELTSEDLVAFSLDRPVDTANPNPAAAERLETEREEVRRLMGTEDRFFVTKDLSLLRVTTGSCDTERRVRSVLSGPLPERC